MKNTSAAYNNGLRNRFSSSLILISIMHCDSIVHHYIYDVNPRFLKLKQKQKRAGRNSILRRSKMKNCGLESQKDRLCESGVFLRRRTWECKCGPIVSLKIRYAYKNVYEFPGLRLILPIPVAARSKAWVCGHSLAGIAVSNTAKGMYVCLMWVLCVVRWRSLRRADHSSREVLPSVVCLNECDRETSIIGRPWPTLGCCAIGKKGLILIGTEQNV
jgi:hypothetical protein